MWHVIIKVDEYPLPVVFHECDGHFAVSRSLECSCGECNLTPPTPCNCRRPVPCTRCARGESPVESEAIATVLKAQMGK